MKNILAVCCSTCAAIKAGPAFIRATAPRAARAGGRLRPSAWPSFRAHRRIRPLIPFTRFDAEPEPPPA